jgi:hypothetical protein
MTTLMQPQMKSGLEVHRYFPGLIVTLEGVLSISALAAAVCLLTGAMDFGETVTKRLPFQSPVLAAVALATFIGLFPLAVIVASLANHGAAPRGHIAVGFVLMVWIVVQVGFIGFTSPLQPLLFLYGANLAALAAGERRMSARAPRPHR